MKEFHRKVRDKVSGEFTSFLTVHVLVTDANASFVGVAECSDRDEFKKELGKDIARGRAEAAAANSYGWLKRKDYELHEVHLITSKGSQIEGVASLRKEDVPKSVHTECIEMLPHEPSSYIQVTEDSDAKLLRELMFIVQPILESIETVNDFRAIATRLEKSDQPCERQIADVLHRLSDFVASNRS